MVGVLDDLIRGGRSGLTGMSRGIMDSGIMGSVPNISMRGVSAAPFRPFLGPQPVATGQLDPRDFPTSSMLSRGLMASGGGAAQAPAADSQGLLGAIRSGLGGMSEEMALGLAGSLLGGPTRTPVGFGTKILRGLQAGREAEFAEEQRDIARLNLESARRKLEAEATLQEGIKEGNETKISQAMLAIAPVQYLKLLQDRPTLSEEFKQYLDKNPELKTQYFEKKIQGGDLFSQFLTGYFGGDDFNQDNLTLDDITKEKKRRGID